MRVCCFQKIFAKMGLRFPLFVRLCCLLSQVPLQAGWRCVEQGVQEVRLPDQHQPDRQSRTLPDAGRGRGTREGASGYAGTYK